MPQIEWEVYACRSAAQMALVGAIVFGSIACNAQTAAPPKREAVTVPTTSELNAAAQPKPNFFDDTVERPNKPKKVNIGQKLPSADEFMAETERVKAEAGDAESQFQLGNRLLAFVNFDGDVNYYKRQGIEWLKKAARQGHSGARKKLAQIATVEKGKGVKVDDETPTWDSLSATPPARGANPVPQKPLSAEEFMAETERAKAEAGLRAQESPSVGLPGLFGVVAISVLLALVCAFILWNLLGKNVKGSSPVATGRRWMNWVVMISCIQPLTRFFSQLMNGHGNPGNVLAQGIAGTVGLAVIAFGIGATWAYLRNRKPKDAALPVEPPNATPVAAHGNSVAPAPVNEPASFAAVPREEFWSSALAEFDSTARRPGLWARAFAEAQGNEAVAKANYLRYRASELEEAHQLQDAERQRELAQATQLTAQGTCPNPSCKAVIPLSGQECPKCGATFGGESGWSVRPIET